MKNPADRIVAGIMAYLKKSRQTDLLPEIIRKLQDLAGRNQPAAVESAIALAEEEKAEIARWLKEFQPEAGTPVFRVNPDLIGGMKVEIGGQIIDLSVRNELDQLHEQI